MELAQHLDFDSLNYKDETLQDFYQSFINSITEAINICIPEVTKKKKSKPSQPWFTAELKFFRRALRSSESHRLKNGKNKDDWCNYKIIRSQYKAAIRHAKTEFYTKKFKIYKKDSKSLYKLVSQLTGTEKENTLPHAESFMELANKFADFFINKINQGLSISSRKNPV